MKKDSSNEDMPEEIDFTGGVRGKYASGYREGVTIRETVPPDPIAFYETQSRLGHALWRAQILEAAFVTYFSLVLEMAVRDAGEHAHEILEHSAEKKHYRDVWRSFNNSEGLADRFNRIVLERNWIVHRCSFDLVGLVSSPRGRQDMAVRLEGFADEAQYLTQHLFKVIELTLAERGLTHSEIGERTQKVIEEWATP